MKEQFVSHYRKSSFSDDRYTKTRCVEVSIEKNRVLVRNSRKKFIAIEFTPEEWEAFIRGVKQNEFNLLG